MVTERLLVDLRDDGLVQVSSWPAREQFPRAVGDAVELVWPLADEDLADLRWYLEQYLRLPTAVYGERGARVAERLPQWGEEIFASVFGAGPARDAYVAARARGGGVEIALLSKSAEQLGRPWELMADPGRGVPVALDGVALSRSLQSTGMADVFEVPGSRLRVLMVISRPGGTADVGYQMIARPLLRRLEAVRGSVELVVLRPPTLERLGEVLAAAQEAGEPFQVVHFDGHGVFGRAPVGGSAGGWGSSMYRAPGPQGMLAFEKPGGGGDLVEAGRVAQVLSRAKVPLVVLNACQSAQVGTEVEAAVATRLLSEGCASVVAMAYSVYAVAAAEFMTAFYERLFAGDRVTDAVTAGRAQLRRNDKRPSMKGMLPLADWMVPVLYTRSEARFPDLRPTRVPHEDVADILTRIRERPQGSEETGHDRDLDPVDAFVGRDADFYDLDTAARLQRVIVLHGPGGTGKSELAKAFGRWWRDTGGVEYPHWVIWHSFEPGVASFGLDGVLTRIGLQVFGPQFALLDPTQRQAAVEELIATRRLLMIWDNFESVRVMPDAGQATPPLSPDEQDRMRAFLVRVARSRSAVIVTSRTPEHWLGPDLRRMALGGLNEEDATAYAEQLMTPYPAAGQRRQTAAFAHLMKWLDGHPLSMRLTLPHLDGHTAQHLLERLQGTAGLPEGDGAGDRRTSLAASIAYSFRHLTREDQQALTVLSLFQGVADAVVLKLFSAQPETPERFRGRSSEQWAELMRRAEEVGLLTGFGGSMFRLHPALPAHLASEWRVQAPDAYDDERVAAMRALTEAHAAFGDWLSKEIDGGNAQLALGLVGSQQRMLGSMLGNALDHHQWVEARLIVQPLNTYWDAQGLGEEARSWADRVQQSVEGDDGTPPDPHGPAGALWLFTTGAQATRDREAGRLDRAERACRATLHVLQQDGESVPGVQVANVYHELGQIEQARGRLEGAKEWFGKARAIFEEHDRRPGLAGVYHELGVIAETQGQLEEAENWHLKSLAIERERGNRPGMALSYHELGNVAFLRRQLVDAEDWYRKSLALRRSLGNRPGAAATYHSLGLVAQERGRLVEAEEWYRQSLTINEDLGNRPDAAATYHQLGRVAQQRGRLEEAEKWSLKSLAIKRELGKGLSVAASYHELGDIAFRRRQLEQAEDWYRQALTLREDLGDRSGKAIAYNQLGAIAHLRGRQAEAEDWYRRSLTIKEELGNHPGMAFTYAQLALLEQDRAQPARALTWAVRSVSLFEEIPHPSTNFAPALLRSLTAQLGVQDLEQAWLDVTGRSLPPSVRDYVLAHPMTTEGDDPRERGD